MIAGTCLIAQLISLIDRMTFLKAVKEHKTERFSKGFSSWSQFVSLLFSQLAGANSLREITGGMASFRGKLNHLGLSEAPSRSTLAYANEHRPWQFFESLFYSTFKMVKGLADFHHLKFKFKNPLYSLDSTVIDLCLSIFDWAKFRRTKGAVKLHLLLDCQGCLPCWALISDGKCADVSAARLLNLPAGAIVAMDRGYNDYELFGQWCERGIFFVTRLKDSADYRIVGRRILTLNDNVIGDETIEFNQERSRKRCPYQLRLVRYHDPVKGEDMTFLTNNFKLVASTIAAIYKERWQIELFFKAMKQYLKVKTFLGTSENAVKSQLWTALIAMLLMKLLQMKSRLGWSLSNLFALFRINCLVYTDLWEWIDNPFSPSKAKSQDDGWLF